MTLPRSTPRSPMRRCVHRVRFELRPPGLEQGLDGGKDLIGQLVALRPKPSTLDSLGRCSSQATDLQSTEGWHVVHCLFYRWVAELEPSLREMDAQHGCTGTAGGYGA